MSAVEYLRFSVHLLRGTGLIPSSSFTRKLISVTFIVPSTFILNLLILYNFTNVKGDILLIAEAVESLSTHAQISVRIIVFLLHGHLIEEILEDCRYQWRYNIFGPLFETELRNNMKLCLRGSKFLGFASVGTVFLMTTTTLFDTSKSVPLACWIPDFNWAKEIIFVTEVVLLLDAVYCVVATDSFYLLVGMDVQNQFQLMGKVIKSLQFEVQDNKECLRKMTKCVQHHRRLLRIHKKLNVVFSEYFLVQYTITVTAVAIQGYLVMSGTVSYYAVLKSIIYFFTIMFQVALYFIPASNIELEAESFSREIYGANWEASKSRKVNKHLLFMLMKSQETLNMKGGGMLHINRPEYISIVRLGFTIATILGGLK